MNYHAARAHPGEHDEMVMVPVQDAGQAKPPQMWELGAKRTSGEPHARGDTDEVVQGRAPQRQAITPSQCCHVHAVAVAARDHCKAGQPAFCGLCLQNERRPAPDYHRGL